MPNGLLGLLLSQALQIAILALIVWGLVQTVARDRSHLAHALWALVLVKCMTPPLWNSPTGVFSWLLQPIAAASNDKLRDRDSQPLRESSLTNDGRSQEAESRESGHVVVRVAPIDESAGSAELTSATLDNAFITRASAGNRSDRIRWGTIACSVWMIGSLLGLITFIARFAIFLRRLRRMPVIDNPNVDRCVQRLTKQLRLRSRVVRVKIIDGAIGPAVLGIFRPTILLPRVVVDDKPIARIEPLLAHEMIHIRRGDLWWAMLQSVAKSLWWFYPPVWVAAKMQSREAEQSCDEETIAGLRCEPAVYARVLLEVLEQKNQLHVAPALPGVRPVDVTAKRLERIMRLEQGSCRKTPKWVWVFVLLAGLAVLPGTGLVNGQEEEARDGDSPTQKVLPNPPRVLSANHSGWAVDRIDVGPILKSLTVSGLSDEAAKSKLLERLPAFPADSIKRNASLFANGKTLQLGGDQPRMRISAGTLYVFDSAKNRQIISEQVEHCRRYGFDTLLIQATMFQIPADQWNEMEIPWIGGNATTTAGLESSVNPNAGAKNSSVVRAIPTPAPANDQPRQVPTATDLSAGVHRAIAVDAPKNQLASPLQHASATTVIEATMDSDQARKVVRSLKKECIIARPQIMTLNGREASVAIQQTRSFVVGYKNNSKNGRQVFEPVTHDVNAGTVMRLRPVLTGADNVRLEFRLEVSKYRSVQSLQLPIKNDGNPLQVQIPEIVSTYIESTLDIQLGKTVVFGGLLSQDKGKPNRLLCFIHCERVAADVDHAESLPDPIEAGTPYDPALSETREDRESSETESSLTVLEIEPSGEINPNSVPAINLLGKSNTSVAITGKLESKIEGNNTLLRGEHLSIRWGDGDAITSDVGSIGFARRGETEGLFRGHVKININGLQLTADVVKIVGDRLTASGHVGVEKGTLELSGDELTWQQGSTISLRGNVRSQAPTTRLSAESIEWDPETNNIEAARLKGISITVEDDR